VQHGFIQHGVFFINPAWRLFYKSSRILYNVASNHEIDEIMPTVEDAHVDDGAEDVQPAAAR
jgi:hypothetical protein